jgi:hypothetical protein
MDKKIPPGPDIKSKSKRAVIGRNYSNVRSAARKCS